jgi:hypothetical protein
MDLTRHPDRRERLAEENLDLLGQLRDPVGADGMVGERLQGATNLMEALELVGGG